MGSYFIRLSAIALVLMGIAGCANVSGVGAGGNFTGSSTAVTFTFSGAAPAVAAAKIGTGSFAARTVSSNSLVLSVPHGTSDFAVAFVCPPQPVQPGSAQPAQPAIEWVIEATTADGTEFTPSCPEPTRNPPTGEFTGSVDGSAIPGLSSIQVNASNANWNSGYFGGAAGADFSFAAPLANDRVQVLAYQSNAQGGVPQLSLLAVRNLNDQKVPGTLNGGDAVVLAAADRTASQAIAYNNVPSGFHSPTTRVLHSNAGSVSGFLIADAAANEYPVLPAGAMENGDSYQFTASARDGAGGSVVAIASSTTAGRMSFTFPTPWSYSGPRAAALPSFDFSYSGFAGRSDVNEAAMLQWDIGASSLGHHAEKMLTIVRTANYGQGSTTMAVPDLSGVAGFIAPPPPGTTVNWRAFLEQASFDLLAPQPSSSTGSLVANSGSYIVP